MFVVSRTWVPRTSRGLRLFVLLKPCSFFFFFSSVLENHAVWGCGSNGVRCCDHHEARGSTHLDNTLHRRLRGHARNPRLGLPIHYGPAGGVHELLLRRNRTERAPSNLLFDGLHVLLLSETDRETSLARRALRLSRGRWGRTAMDFELPTSG